MKTSSLIFSLAALTAVSALLPSTQAATIVVNSTDDPAGYDPNITIATLGPTVRLRDAVNAANNTAGDDTIVFDPALAGQTITLAQVGHTTAQNSALLVASRITITAPTGGITISRSTVLMRHFFVAGGGSLTLEAPAIDGLTLRNGDLKGDGASIYNLGALRTTRVAFMLNSADSFSLGDAGR
ncbi:MAG TPA: hypothetical protein VG095_07315, partial [Chthoniobacterales bacterium]|nr:hypothetical protein [Chthoniobacterales bacterium]